MLFGIGNFLVALGKTHTQEEKVIMSWRHAASVSGLAGFGLTGMCYLVVNRN